MNAADNSSLRLAVMLVLGVSAALSPACGSLQKKSVSSDAGAGDSSSLSNFDSPGTLAVGSSTVAVPQGALDNGNTLTVADANTGSQFNALTDAGVSQSSGLVSVSATTADGNAINQTKTPLTIALSVTSQASLVDFMANIPAVEANLCAVGLGTDGALRLWRRGALTADTSMAGRMTFKTIWLGKYQLFYCGALPIANYAEATSDGTTASLTIVNRPIAACHVVQSDGYSRCDSYSGLAYADNLYLAQFRTNCTNAHGTFGSDTCDDKKAIGTCLSDAGTVKELATVLSAPTPAPDAAALNAVTASFKAGCLNNSANTWAEPGTLQTTPFAHQH